jgi:hypothetical protein
MPLLAAVLVVNHRRTEIRAVPIADPPLGLVIARTAAEVLGALRSRHGQPIAAGAAARRPRARASVRG